MTNQLSWGLSPFLCLPVAIGLIATLRLHRRRPGTGRATALLVRDLLTLGMVMRNTEPDQRADLLRAHRAWRTESRR